MAEHAPILIIVFPLLAAFLTHLTKYVKLERGAELVAFASMLASLSVLVISAPAVLAGRVISYNIGGWTAPLGISLVLDGFSFFFCIVIVVIGLLLILYSLGVYLYARRYYSLLLIALSALFGIALTRDLFNLYVFFEILAVSSYVLIAYKRRPRTLKASFRYLMITESAWVFFLLAIAMLYGLTGTLNMDGIAQKIPMIYQSSPYSLFIIFSIMLVAFGIKCGMAPLHSWIPEAHSQAPTPVSGLLSGLILKAGIFAMLRVFYLFFVGVGPFSTILLYVGLITLLFGALMALVQDELKKLLAYSSINQIGFILVGIGIGTTLGLKGALFHLLNHAIMKTGLFFCAGIIISQTGFWKIERLRGVYKRMPGVAISFFLLSLAIVGIPFFNGFASKLLVILATLKQMYYIPGIILLLGIVISAAYYFKVLRIFFNPEESREVHDFVPRPVGPFEHFAVYLCVVFCVVIGIFPGIIFPILEPAVKVLLP
ncbi:MAG: hypothetical protein HQ564_01715 [Candidatus Saganbacteria bacterium]|nr:hypothetical protein [Candidatus Saganbacteria bacterium]